MPMPWRSLMSALFAVALWACDDEPSPDCAEVASPCESDGERRCGGGEGEVEECREDADGCLQWQSTEPCGERQRCQGQGECLCQDECDSAGMTSCDAEVLVECVSDADGCLYEQDQRDCETADQACAVFGGEAMCVGCAEDVCDEAGALRCQRNVLQTCSVRDDECLDWENTTDCAALDPPQVCSDESGTASCVEGCVDECENAGDTRCNDTVIETCVVQDDDCLVWTSGTDCGPDGYCDDGDGEASCMTCINSCTIEAATRCDGSVIETCIADEHGCMKWEAGLDCAVLDPVQVCEYDGDDAICAELSGSGSCADPIVISTAHFVIAGTDFTADFSDNQTLAGTGCRNRPASPDAVFSLDLSAGQTVRVRETSDFDAVLSLMMPCSDASVCEFSEDVGESDGYEYTASADETVFVVVEPWDSEPRILYYEIRIDIVEDEVCDNNIDDDADGNTDCDDDECFGEGDCAAAEHNCGDGGDNDGDGTTDCEDTDCDDAPICGPYMGLWEAFAYDQEKDLGGHAVAFIPDRGEPNDYSWSVTDISDFTVTPGTGTVSMVVELTDDDAERYTLTVLPEFPFYGESYDSLYVGSNGYITFGDWDIIFWPTEADFFELPTVAGLWTDLVPELPSTVGPAIITIDEFVDRVVVTFQSTPIWYDVVAGFVEGPNDVQMILNDDGSIEIDWVTINASNVDVYVGISNGIGTGSFPAQVDFIP